jgi:hypothetical protein
VGTIGGMMLVTAAVAVPFAYTARRLSHLNRHLAAASGLLSLLFGLYLVYQIGWVDGLFTGHRPGPPSELYGQPADHVAARPGSRPRGQRPAPPWPVSPP